MWPHENVDSRSAGSAEKSWWTTSSIYAELTVNTAGTNRRRGTHWRHCPAGENHRPCGIDYLLEVRRGVEVLVFDLDLPVHYRQGDTSICTFRIQ